MFFLHNYPRHLGHMVPKSLTNPRLHPARIHSEIPHRDEPTAEAIFAYYSILHMLNSCNQYNMTYFLATFYTTVVKKETWLCICNSYLLVYAFYGKQINLCVAVFD